jgi:hypothetical protein
VLPPRRHDARKSRVASIRIAFIAPDMGAAREIREVGLRQQARVGVEWRRSKGLHQNGFKKCVEPAHVRANVGHGIPLEMSPSGSRPAVRLDRRRNQFAMHQSIVARVARNVCAVRHTRFARAGELAIARDAATLRKKALDRLTQLEAASGER